MTHKHGPDDMAHGVPPVSVSSTSTRVNKTGSWKYIRPVYMDKVAPCNQRCPVGIDIEGYMNLLREGRTNEALDVLLRENPLPAVTGRVCYHPCEGACNRRSFDEPVAVHAVERSLGDTALEIGYLPQTAEARAERVAVVGSGPAGLACAYHLALLGYAVTVFEAEEEPGGILRYGIPEYRLPRTVLAREIHRIKQLGVEFRCGVRVGKDLPWSEIDTFDAAFMATGVHRSKSLGKEFQGITGVRAGLDFLKEVARGGRPDIGKKVIVVGGGNTAIDCARTAVRLGAEVTLLYRRSREEMPATPAEVEDAIEEGVIMEFLAAPGAARTEEIFSENYVLDAIRSMYGDGDSLEPEIRLVGLECQRMSLGEPDESGRRRPEPVPGSQFLVTADTVLTALGEDPDFEGIPSEIRRVGSTIQIDGLGGTTRVAFFAGGDIVEEPHTVAYAIGSGKRSALGIDHFLRHRNDAEDGTAVPLDEAAMNDLRLGQTGNLSATRWKHDDPIRRVGDSHEVAQFKFLNKHHFEHASRHEDQLVRPDERRGNFTEVNRGLAHDDALAEATRCFNCGVCNGCELCLIFCADVAIHRRVDGGGFTIDYEYCKGCGICAAECPRGAITMTREGL